MRIVEVILPHASPDFWHWFGNSKVVDKGGRPLRVFHGTNTQFDQFFPMSHFGTAVAANQRVGYRTRQTGGAGYVVPVYLRIENPLRVSDAEASEEPALLNAIIRGKYPQLDIDTARSQGVHRALKDAGYDGLVYNNRVEHRGRLSWVPLDHDQIMSAVGEIVSLRSCDMSP
jgi:hypothetical protein